MKKVLLFFCLLISFSSNAQINLEPKELEYLVKLGELYSKNSNIKSEEHDKKIEYGIALDSLRIPILNNIINKIISTNLRNPEKIVFNNVFLQRPNDIEMYLWYVISRIHRNMSNKITPYNTIPIRENSQIANEILSNNIDNRLLINNYYLKITDVLKYPFLISDISTVNIDIEALGLKNDVEKTIFFLQVLKSLSYAPISLYKLISNNQEIISYSEKLPTFNGKQYFYYKNLSDGYLDWIENDTTELFYKRIIDVYYAILKANFIAIVEIKGKDESKIFFSNSILNQPKYFKHSFSQDNIQKLYDTEKSNGN